jgi:hypothetical protein
MHALGVALVLLLAACAKPTAPEAVADKFVQAYFVKSDMAGAVALANGSAKAKLAAILQQIQSAGAREPAKDEPRVKATLAEQQSISAGAVGFVYRVESDTPGIQPITATLRLTKEGNTWYVSDFSQSP